MSKPMMTYSLAMSVARDEGNRSMRAAGRTCWAVKDFNAAVATFEKLWPSDPGELLGCLPAKVSEKTS